MVIAIVIVMFLDIVIVVDIANDAASVIVIGIVSVIVVGLCSMLFAIC